MIRTIIKIDEQKCNGCGICAAACHEGAIEIIDNKAKLVRENFCDGFGDCLPGCPAGAISFEEREAPAYDEKAVKQAKALQSALTNWPVQIKLAPIQAPYFAGADLLIAADCTAYAYANFHSDFIKNRVALIGCPKLDAVSYKEKLSEIISNNRIASILLVRMEVPCCGGLEVAVKNALDESGKDISMRTVIISRSGSVVSK
ncbi:MAG: 4Fe-4S binding protein [Agathobacter sp.]|nr:4Fe-4S binding protein [Agathobacter sp.]